MPRNDDEDDLGTFELPRMGTSELEGVAWVQACVDEMAAGRLGTKKFAALMSASSKVATLLKHHHERTEILELRELLAMAERQKAEADEREKKIQQGRAPH